MASLVLIVVAFHPSSNEVDALARCFSSRSSDIDAVVIANDYFPGEPVDQLQEYVDLFVTSKKNLGYGRGFHVALDSYRSTYSTPKWVAVLNTDLSWEPGTFEGLVDWLEQNSDVVLAVPKIFDSAGNVVHLCKRDPTILSLASRRFLPDWLKPSWLRRYDAYQLMADYDLDDVFDVPYLSGCCMVFRCAALDIVGGFDRRFFLYLEDADITRRLRSIGRCVHVPLAQVKHAWGRGNHRSRRLTLVNLQSAWIYFRKWGWSIF